MGSGSLGNAVGEYLAGLADPWRGFFFLLARPRLWFFAAIPFVLTLVLYAGLMYLGWRWISGWIDGLLPAEGSVWRVVGVLLAILYWILGLILSALAFMPAAVIVASPFNDLLSEKTEYLSGVARVDEPFSVRRFLLAASRGVASDLARALKVGVLLFLAFFLNFIPGAGPPIAAAVSAFTSISYLAVEYTSYSMDRRLFTWREKQDYLSRHRARTLGFGTMAFAIMLIPVVNAAFIPVSAVAGTLLFCETELRRKSLR